MQQQQTIFMQVKFSVFNRFHLHTTNPPRAYFQFSNQQPMLHNQFSAFRPRSAAREHTAPAATHQNFATDISRNFKPRHWIDTAVNNPARPTSYFRQQSFWTKDNIDRKPTNSICGTKTAPHATTSGFSNDQLNTRIGNQPNNSVASTMKERYDQQPLARAQSRE